MPQLSRAQSIVTATTVTLVVLYLGVVIAGPVLEYLHGPSPETVLLKRLTDAGSIALAVLFIAVLIMQRIGVLPTIRIQAPAGYQPTPRKQLRNLAIWIVIALLLVFLFNFFQTAGRPPGQIQNDAQNRDSMAGLIINLSPVFLLIGVWIFFLRQMQRRKNNDPPDSTTT